MQHPRLSRVIARYVNKPHIIKLGYKKRQALINKLAKAKDFSDIDPKILDDIRKTIADPLFFDSKFLLNDI